MGLFGDLEKTLRFIAFLCLMIPRVTPTISSDNGTYKIHVFVGFYKMGSQKILKNPTFYSVPPFDNP